MPTPMPTMDAMVGAMLLTSVTAASTVISDEPIPSPTRATASGSPAAMTDPNANSRITRATATPTNSAVPLGGAKFSGTSPPSSTWTPVCCSSAAADHNASTPSEPVKSVTGTP